MRRALALVAAASVCDGFTDAARHQATLAARSSTPAARVIAYVIDDATGFERSRVQLEAIGLDVRRLDPVYMNETSCAGAGVANMSRSTMRKKVGVAEAHFAAWSAIAQEVELGTTSVKDPVLVLEADWTDESTDQRRNSTLTRDVIRAAAKRSEDYVMLGWCGLSTTVAYMMRAQVAKWLSQLPQGGCGLTTDEEMACPVDWLLATAFVTEAMSLSRVKGATRLGNWGRGYIQQALPANFSGDVYEECDYHEGDVTEDIEFETPSRAYDEMTSQSDACEAAIARLGARGV